MVVDPVILVSELGNIIITTLFPHLTQKRKGKETQGRERKDPVGKVAFSPQKKTPPWVSRLEETQTWVSPNQDWGQVWEREGRVSFQFRVPAVIKEYVSPRMV